MTYETMSGFAQTGGLIYFVILFGIAVAYALWPSNKDKFKAAARSPLEEREPSDD